MRGFRAPCSVSIERYYSPNFDVAVAVLLAGFGSNVAALTVAVLVKGRKGSRPLFSGVPFLSPFALIWRPTCRIVPS